MTTVRGFLLHNALPSTNTDRQAMIEDLKADSARWDSERRAQTTRNTSGGIESSRNASAGFARLSSDASAVQYRSSETHQSRQNHGPTEGPYQSDPYPRDASYDGPRYPGSGAPGYTGSNAGYPPQPTYASASGGNGNYGGYAPQHSPGPDARYGSNLPMNAGFQGSQDGPYISTGANMARGYNNANDIYSPNRMVTSAPLQGSSYVTSAPQQQGYPASSPSPYQYSSQALPPVSATQAYSNMPPQDPYYGRGV